MSNSHYTCDSRSILTKTCRKPKPVAFALHLSQNGVSPGGFNLLSSGNLRPTGVIGGAQIGANYEFAPWVVGIEASLDRFCDRRKHPDRYNSGRDLSAGALHVSSQVVCCCDRTRNDWLFYAKAGGAWTSVRYTEDIFTPGGATAFTQVLTDDRTGFTVGAGIEFGLVENLSGKIEYDFYDFGSKNYNFNAITPVSVSSNLHTIIVGLNYRFNWSGGPKP